MGKGIRVGVAAVVAALLTGCSSVRMVQRDGCWIRQTERWPKQINEEMGPCARKEPKWVEDRLARLVQECMAQSDYRWQTEALLAWNKSQPLPARKPEEAILQSCMNEAATAMVTENEALRQRLSELTEDRDELRVTVDEDRAHIRSSHDRLASALGDAAKKPAPAAVATATSNGTATTQSELSSDPSAPVPTTLVSFPGCGGSGPAMEASAERTEDEKRSARTSRPDAKAKTRPSKPVVCTPEVVAARPDTTPGAQVDSAAAPSAPQAAPAMPAP